MIAVKVASLEKRFDKEPVLQAVDLEIDPGELFFLLGPSGCGKTTLLRCLAGFYKPDAGAIFFGEEEVTHVAPHKRETGMMFQSYALWPHMTVAENVAFGLEQRKIRKNERLQRVAEALEAVHMGAYAERRPNQLSGGQQQRVALARALVIRPRCLLLDEPLSNLDAKLRLEMRQEIRRVCKENNLTTIYVTHDQKEALSVADRMSVMDAGRILQTGTPQEIYRRPCNRMVADFLGESNFLEGRILRSEGGFAYVETSLGAFTGVIPEDQDDPADGSNCLLSIRPECLHLERMPVEENVFTGSLGSSVYYGETAQYSLDCSGKELKIYELNPKYLGRQGENLYAWADPEDIVVLPAF